MRPRLASFVFIGIVLSHACQTDVSKTSVCPPLPMGDSAFIPMTRGETHCYSVALKAEESIEIRVDQVLIDIRLRATNQQGQSLIMDGRYGSSGDEWLPLTATQPGTYTLSLEAGFADSDTSGYRLLVRPLAHDERIASGLVTDLVAMRAMIRNTSVARQDKADALQKLKQALTSATPGDQTGAQPTVTEAAYRARAWETIAYLSRDLPQKDQPFKEQQFEAFSQASNWFGLANDPANQCFSALTASELADRLERGEEMETWRRQALGAAESSGKPHLTGRAQSRLAYALMKQGHFEEALGLMQKTLTFLNAQGDKNGTARQNDDIGLLLLRTGDFDNAAKHFLAAEHLWQVLSFERNQVLSQSERAWAEFYGGNRLRGIDLLENCIKQLDQPQNLRFQTKLHDRLGTFQYLNNDLPLAREFHQKVLDSDLISDRQKDTTRINLARISIIEKKWDEAEQLVSVAFLRYNAQAQPLEFMSMLMLQARIATGRNDHQAAQDYAKQALALLHRLRADINDVPLGLNFMGPRNHFLDFLLDLFFKHHQQYPDAGFDIEALQFFEWFQNFYMVQEEHRHHKQNQPQTGGTQPDAGPPPIQRETLIQMAKDYGAILLVYHLGQTEGHLWVVRETGITWEALPDQNALIADLKLFQETFCKEEPTNDMKKLADEADALGRILLQAIKPDLLAAAQRGRPARLMIVADDHLGNLPFAALNVPDTGEPLVKFASHSLQPSLTFTMLRRKKRADQPTRGLLLVANPSFTSRYAALPNTALEAACLQEIKQPLDRLIFTEDAATLAAWRQSDPGNFALIHIATHGRIPYQGDAYQAPGVDYQGLYPTKKALVFADAPSGAGDDHLLNLPEVRQTRFLAELVTLSACHSGISDVSQGEGVWGLDETFLSRGARRVVATLRDMDDEALRRIMCTFYQETLVNQTPVDLALQKAQLEIINTGHFSDARYWAGLALSGEPTAIELPANL